MLQMSAWTPSYCFPSITSGAVYTYEPQFVLRSSDFFTCRAKPKSVKKGGALYHRMIIIWYYNINRYSRISKNNRHIHVYNVIKALVRCCCFFFVYYAYIVQTYIPPPRWGGGGMNCVLFIYICLLCVLLTLQIPAGSGCAPPPSSINPCMLFTYKKSSNFLNFYQLPINLRLKQESSIRFSNLMSRWQMFSEWR